MNLKCVRRWFVCPILLVLQLGVTAQGASLAFDIPDIPDIPGGIPPFLLTSNPFNGATGVAVNASVTFTFFTAMAPKQAITWSDNVANVTFVYTWSADGKTLTCTHATSFPASSTITWELDPTVFEDPAGTPLLELNNTGAFTTGSGQGEDPCSGGSTNSTLGTVSLSKLVYYLQTSTATPALDPEMSPTFAASVRSPATDPVTQVSLQLPNGTSKTLTNFFGQFLLSDTFPSVEAMDAAYPPGSYLFTVQRNSGTRTASVSMSANLTPPTPQLADFAQLESFDPAQAFTLEWARFTGATDIDALSVEVSDGLGKTFRAPDPCHGIELANSATSITIPQDSLGVGGQYEGSLTFMKMTGIDTNTLNGMAVFGGYSKTTRFRLQNGGTAPEQPELVNLTRRADGLVEFQVRSTEGKRLIVEGSADLQAGSWLQVTNVASSPAVLQVADPQAAGQPRRLYRAQIPFP